MNENPVTPRQDIETPSQSFTTQTRADLPRQSEKRKPLSRLFRWVSLLESQFKAVTPRDTEITEQEAIDYSVPPPRRRSIPSPEFINQTFEVDPRDTKYLQLNREEKPTTPFIHFMDDNGVIWNQSDLYNMDPTANSTETTNLTDTVPLADHSHQQLVNFSQNSNANGTVNDGAIGGMGEITNRNVVENNMSHTGGLGLSSPLQESMLMNDQTEYRVPVNIPVLHDLSVPNMHHTPQAVEMSSMVGNSTSQTGNSVFSPVL